MFDWQGLLSNLIVGGVGVLASAALTVFVLERLRIRREKQEWVKVRSKIVSELRRELARPLVTVAYAVNSTINNLISYLGETLQKEQWLPSSVCTDEMVASEIEAAARRAVEELSHFPVIVQNEAPLLEQIVEVEARTQFWRTTLRSAQKMPDGKEILRTTAQIAVRGAGILYETLRIQLESETKASSHFDRSESERMLEEMYERSQRRSDVVITMPDPAGTKGSPGRLRGVVVGELLNIRGRILLRVLKSFPDGRPEGIQFKLGSKRFLLKIDLVKASLFLTDEDMRRLSLSGLPERPSDDS